MNNRERCQGCIFYRVIMSDGRLYGCHYCYDTYEPRDCAVEVCDKRQDSKPSEESIITRK